MSDNLKKNNAILLLEKKLGIEIESEDYEINENGEVTYLDLSNNNITDISALANLDNIRILCLSYNEITDISALGNLGQIEALDLRSNKIANISALGELDQIETLDLDT